ncbi:MAG TPA: non-ribosomal peptide synthase/polyketide synthase, partial [Thermoanaerobaculia bacterium]|nr:non-ribosomal peptide synthase/polyketide synthase [Thermoanaerobaculia bacterium]
CASPERLLSDLVLLTEAERDQLLREWNDTAVEVAEGLCIHELFEHQAIADPEAVALIHGEESIGYGELNCRAEQLANRLRRLGAGPERIVGVFLERKPELVVALLGVLKSGGAYLPLDPAYPAERLGLMLADSGAIAVVSRAELAARLPGSVPLCPVEVEEEREEAAAGSALDVEVGAENLAYLIYTSGSTGRPKAVAICHCSAVRLLDWAGEVFGPRELSRVLAATSVGFDLSVFELFLPLSRGGTVVLAANALALPGLGAAGVTLINTVPSAMAELVRTGGLPSTVRTVNLAGEALPRWLVEELYRTDHVERVYNLYGPSEDTTYSTFALMASGGLSAPAIGRPIDGTRVYVLDGRMSLQPLGVPGELWIGGEGLARGYLRRPGLTAERFVPDPFGSAPGGRLYRTGDLVRYRLDGDLEFLGRRDHQVKLRGFRIELGEIEAALEEQAGVAGAVVEVRADGRGDRRLVAYVAGEGLPEPGELRAYLARRLPDYMVPSVFVPLAALPLSPNGKVDRRALPAPERVRSAVGEDLQAASGPFEELLAGIWSEVLGLEAVGLHDDFFALGGHSLLATQVMSRLRSVLGVELPLRRLFEAPTISGLAGVVRESREGRQASPIVPVPRDGDLPLSFAQQRLWFLDQLEPGSPAYNIPLAVRLTGELSIARLERVFTEVVRRHEALRTTFVSREGSPVQVIASAAASRPELPVVDLSHLPEREERALALAREEALRPFDLEHGPLLRLTLVRLSEGDHVLLLTMHHIVSDGWSMGVLLREIAALSEGSALPELPVQYADFAVWQRSWLAGEVLEGQLAYWRRQLDSTLQVLELPTDRPRPAVQTFRGASRDVSVPPGLSEAVHGLCRREGATPFMVFLTAWAVLLGRHANQEDVLVGTPIAGRNRREVEDLIGLFINTLVLRVDLSDAPGFGELLGRVRQAALDGYTHQDVPFERLVEELAPKRSLAHSPLFQAMLVLQNAPGEGLSVPGLALTPLAIDGEVAKFDLTLTLQEQRDRIFEGALEYNTDLFDGSTAVRMLERFQLLLAGAEADPACPVSELPLLTETERFQMLSAWNDTATAPLAEPRLHRRFQAVAARYPHEVALIQGERRLTFEEVARRAERLAAGLAARGVGPEAVVGLRLERSPELVIAALAVLMSGGAYLPLDPAHPEERQAMLLADAGASLVLSREIWPDAPERDLPEADPEGLAYVLYTSGSTGRPKGVMVQHRALARYLDWALQAYVVEAGRGAPVHSSLGFDLTVTGLWAPLLTGRPVTLLPEEHGVEALATTVRPGADFSLVKLTPAHLDLLAQQVAPESVAGWTRVLVVGGEALQGEGLAFWREHAPETRIFNEYGPTETVVGCSVYEVSMPLAGPLPIGRPIAGARLYVSDRGFRPMPLGVAGELFIGGEGVTRGYRGDPSRTAERFLPDPFSAEPGARLYRSGDLARWRTDGTLEFLGRRDHQVKLRGFRIEPGEIEAALLDCPGVRECVVVAREDVPGVRLLVVYVTGEGLPDPGELRTYLARRLPEYMVPSVFVVLASLPLTPNGKVDRRALPAPERVRPAVGESLQAASGPVEELLAGIWSEVLGLDRVGLHDDFFALGGHSLLATQVMSRLRSVLGVELPLRRLFEAPTISGLAGVVRESREGRLAPPIVPVPRDGDLPLSFAQQRLWFLDQLEPGSPAYNIPLAVRLTGELSIALLARVFTEVVRRHEALRTTFDSREGQPVQVIASAAASRPEVPVVDLSHLPEREERALALAREEALRPFDLEHGPLLRLTLVRLSEGDHVLLLTLHHVVSDGWSMGVLLRETGALYAASPLPELPVQYADFAVWQRSWLAGEVLETQLAYWKRQLDGTPRALELPMDRPRPAVQTFRGASRNVSVPPGLSEAVHGLCRREGATPFMVLLAAWAVLLGRHANQEDVLVGTPIAGRNRREVEDLIGLFINTLVLRVDLSGAPGFGELLGRVRQAALDGYTHQDVPFERLVEELTPERSLAHSPLFQAMLVLQNAPGEDLSVPGLMLTPLPVDNEVEKFDLSLALQEGSKGLGGSLSYNTDLFDASTAARLWARFTALLEAAVADPGLSLFELPLLLPEERHQAIVEWNDTSRPYVPDLCLHELVAQQAERTPDAVAASFEGQELSYRELDRRANRLAHDLIGLGIGPDGRVGVRMERSLEMIVALLGVLKAGAAYVPLDPTYPAERLALLIESSGIEVVLDRDLPGRLEEDLPDTAPVVRAGDANLAYVIHTSGSTGMPKGVMIPHRGIVNRLLWMQEAYPLTPGDRVLQKTPFNFDVSLGELFGPLLAGARLVFARPEGHKDTRYLADVIARERITSVHFVSSMLWAFLEVAGEADLSSVRRVLASGEALPPELVRRFFRFVDAELLNLYGPTEASVEVSVWACEPERPVVPIGRPISNLRLHVVDREMRPQPVGVSDELLLGGVGLARGYLGRPDLTAAAFVPDPFGESGERLYRTGDLARTLADGNVEFLGRIDHQVKVRGFRIELGEIESVLRSHPEVRECVVVAREVLVAYVVGTSEWEALRGHLGRKLPDYMVPAVFVALDALPLTTSGKVDRRALPAPERALEAGERYVAPSDPTEELLAGVWAEVLGVDRVGVDEDFFSLGGHSLLATQVASRIRTVLGVELPLRRLFEAPTVSALARAVRENREGRPAPPILPVSRDGDLPLSFAQQRLWVLDQLKPGSAAYNIPLAVRLSGELPPDRLRRIFAGVVRRHESLRTTFASPEGRPVQVIGPPRVDLPVLDLAHLSEREREGEALALAWEEAGRPFDLERGPLLRLALVRLGDRDHLLLVTMHHIVSDGWSMGVLLREIGVLYADSPLPELPVQYADFAVWQRSWLEGEVLEEQLAYWRRQLAGVPQVLELPTDRPRPAVQTFRGSSLSLRLPAVLSERVRDLCRREGATPFMVLLAAWSALLGRHASQPEVLVGTPIAGRNRREIEGLIGFFVNTQVLRADLSEAPGFGGLVSRVRRAALDAYTHQDLPFDRLVEELVPERDLSRSPLFQVMFTLQNAPGGHLELPGLTLAPVMVESRTTKFDLTLGLQEGAGGFSGGLEYNTDLFDASTAARLGERFRTLLEAAAADLERPVQDLPLLPAPERQQVLVEWSDTARPCQQVPMVHELFSAHARRRPQATAMADAQGRRITYGELEAKSNRLAHHLHGLGVGPEVRVAVCMERTLERAVAILGAVKAGGAYVTLDPTYPRERLAYLLEDVGAVVLLTEEQFALALPGAGTLVLRVDADWPQIQGDEETAPDSGVAPENLAYVVYTSGSTGKPKGVEIPHAGLMNLVRWHQDLYGVQPEDRGTQIASPAFDASIWELWPYLCGGASLYIPDEEARLSSPGMIRWWAEQGITLAYLMTPLAEGVLEEKIPAGLDLQVRALIIGGDRLHRGPNLEVGFRLMNHYGPAEYTVVSTMVQVPPRREGSAGKALPSIGRAIDNTRIYILDREQRPAPVGVAGELYVAGIGLARGYAHRPDLTAEKFVPDPSVAEPGERMYRTGDLVRWLPDGDIDFLGRIDHQVKIRGFRIELGEIESVLGRHPEVREAVVLLREDRPGDKRLAAYVVPAPGARLESQTLRGFLHQELPEHMVPSAFVLLDALPLTSNGKVDRRALPVPEKARSEGGEGAFLDPIEELLAGILAEVLGLGRIGVEEDFFALGGHSLLATQVVSRVRTVLGVEMPLRALFESPTVSGLAQVVRESREGRLAPPIVPVPREGDLPLSFGQQRLWFLNQLEPQDPTYNIPSAVRLRGELSVGLLARIFTEVVRRHEALRTTFGSEAGRPAQVVAPALRPALPVIDLSGLSGREEQARDLARQEARRPFDLSRGPLLRLTLLRLEARDHLLLMTMHHVVSDGWSMGVLVGEVGVLYEAFSRGLPSPLPELPVQYADFAVWQRGWLQGEVLEGQLAYWKRQLGSAPQTLELPTDRPRPAVQTYRGASRPVALEPPLSEAVRAVCRRAGATLFMALLASWAVVLGRHASQEDVLVGTPIAGRNRREIEGLIGFFVNTLVLRADLSGSPGFAAVLARVRQAALDGYTHQDVPFERLVEDLAPERDLSRSPLFQVMLALQNAPGAGLSLPGLTLEPLAVDGGLTKFDLTLSLQEGPAGLAGSLSYNTDLFDHGTAARLWSRFTALVEAAVASPEVPVSELLLLLPAERHQALAEWNDTARAYATGVCLHELISAQTRRTPDAVAASFEDQELTYGELERRANRLAHHLIGLGVEPDGRVGVRMERSLELIVALLGILKAGAAYVPLDPTYPAERLAKVIESSGARVVLTPESWKEIGSQPDTARVVPVGEDNLAYVLFTSGSTGTPKGAMVPHRGIVNRLFWDQEFFRLTAEDRALQKTPLTFDVSVWEIFWPLVTGARLVFARPDGHRDPVYLAELIVREGITNLHFVPSMLQAFLENPDLPDLPSLRLAMSGGEALPMDLMRRFQGRVPRAGMYNRYGPTEASVSVSTWACRPDSSRSIAPIGRPISNLRLYVMDRELRPQPPGVSGELLLGGTGLARGYLGRPDLTAEAFVPDPLAEEGGKGGRLYRTGDLARLLPDGNLEFLSRLDRQVKVRGFRIELGEIEAVLAGHPTVRECAVVVRGDVPNSRLLVAYGTGSFESGTLRAYLAARLPEYMVPAVFVALDTMPLTTSGKVDRRALPAPEQPRLPQGEGYEAAADPTEELLAGIWSEILRLDQVGINEDFFSLGGHSLLATQVVSRVRTVLGTELPLRQVFESPTIQELARAVREARQESGLEAPPIVPVPREDRDLPLSFAQQRLWFFDQLEPGSAVYNIPLAVRASGDLDPGLSAPVFAELIRRHESLRTTFVALDGRPVQRIAAEASPAVSLVDLSGVPERPREEEAKRQAGDEAARPFDLNRGPLVRAVLLRMGKDDYAVLVTMHHIISDGWSMRVFLRELAALYNAFARGEASPLPELPLQYADYAAWQRSWLDGEVLKSELAYWRTHLAGAPPLLELPTDRPRPAVQTTRGRTLSLVLPPELSARLVTAGQREGATLFMVLLSAASTLLGRLADQEDVLVGSPIAGRNRGEVEGLIGMFVNTLVFRADLSGAPGFRRLLVRVRTMSLDAYAHQEMPFDKLVEELAPARSLAHSPLFQVMLLLQNLPMEGLALPGLTLSSLPTESRTTQFDLVLWFAETPRGLAASLQYNLDLFDETTAARMLGQLERLLDGATAEPDRPVSELPLVSVAERHQLVHEWNGAPPERALGLCLQDLLDRQRDLAPDALAVLGEDGTHLTYGELHARADRLARRLRRLGVGPDVPVAVCLERSPELVIALVATLKAGGVYLPVDPSYPPERQAFILEDSGAPVVLDRDTVFDPEAEPAGDLPRPLPQSLAWIIYTSGSTGRPKGVGVEHGGAARHLGIATALYEVDRRDRVLAFSSPSFDVSMENLLLPLAAGAAVALRGRELWQPEGLLERVRELQLTMMDLPTAYFHQWLGGIEGLAPQRELPLRLILIGGEALPAEAERLWSLQGLPGVRLINGYGPSEAIVTATASAGRATIGRPAPGRCAHVLDQRGGLVPVGVAGELCLGGPLLARGYLGRPALTGERFVPDPFAGEWGGEPGSRLYRTGDLARRLPNGELEFLGRVDHQVKVRGFRIEMGEIESVLGSHPAVRECVVAVREDVPGVRMLVAYATGDLPEAGELRAFLAERLPEYMVPAVFVPSEALPLSPNGKVDRQALPAPGRDRELERRRLEPRDLLELRLVRLWEELLHVQPVGVRDDFFELGGHSLLAVQLVARIQKSFGKTLPLAALLRNPTVERLAAVLREEGELSRGLLVELAPGTGRPFFCVHAIGGEVLSYVHLARHLDRPVYGLQAQEGSAWTLEEMAARYVHALREVQPEGPYSLGGWSMGGVVAFEMARQLERQGEAVAPVALIDSFAPEGQERPQRIVADGELVALFARDISRQFGLSLPPLLPDFGELAAEDALRWLSAKAERAGLLPPGAESREVKRRFAVFQANFRLLEGYAGGPCAAPVILFKAAERPAESASDLGWGRLSQGPIEVHELSGDHYTLLQQPHVQTLAALLRERLGACAPGNARGRVLLPLASG